MEQILGALKNEKISSGVLALLLCGAWWAYGWAGEEFVNRNDFDELKGLIITHVADMKIVTASQLIRDKELAVQIANATGESDTQISHIQNEITRAQAYRTCLINEEPNCKHLKMPE